MLEGLMQHDHPLTLQLVLQRARTMNGDAEVVTLTEGEPDRITYAALAERVDRLANALIAMGIGPGDRVATFSWNTQRHLELYLAVPCIGAVLHTLNIRLFPEQVQYIVQHAEDRVVFLDPSLREQWEAGGARCDSVIELGDEYEKLLAAQPAAFDYPDLDDRMAAGLCYTSGTTGNPKGVLYSHRSNILHALGKCLADSVAIKHGDVVMPVVPMFHANAWGFPYACALAGASLVMPSRFVAAEPLAHAIEREHVTITGAVPTVWLDLLRYADEHGSDLSSVQTMVCGGAAVPQSLIAAMEERHGVRIVQGWGMTETSPLASVSREGGPADRARQGRPLPLVETRIVDDAGQELAWDDEATGELQVRGPWIARAYYEDDTSPEKFDGGWLRTGDIAAIAPDGSLRLTDRSKDVIKSGGEWISSVELENALMAHPTIREAAVIARPDERWSERPLACVVLEDGAALDCDELRRHLLEHVAKWWVPEDFVAIDEVPKTSVGKFDKKVLRGRLAEGTLRPAGTLSA
jgi:acyl-CoA synthetase (AMP-forming)/AMP-acid ligase II